MLNQCLDVLPPSSACAATLTAQECSKGFMNRGSPVVSIHGPIVQYGNILFLFTHLWNLQQVKDTFLRLSFQADI